MRKQKNNNPKGFTALFMLLLTLFLIPRLGMALTQDASAPRQGLCGTCKLSIANTGKVLYKIAAGNTLNSLEPVPKTAAYITENIVMGYEKSFKFLRFDNKAMLTEKSVVKAIGDHCIIWVNENVEVGDNQALMTAYQFDDVIYDTVRANFGYEPNTGIDGNPKINIILTDIKDIPEGTTFVRGYFNPADEHLANQDNTTSNEIEAIYIDVVDQEIGKVDYFRTIAHQFCHMVLYNMDTRAGTRGTREQLWVDEGMCLMAEYLCDYGHPHEYIQAYLSDTNTSLVMSDVRDWAMDTPWKNYGASYLFTLYVYEHFGTDFIRKWAQTEADGIQGFNTAMNQSGRTDTFDSVFSDWMIANLIDDVSVKEIATYGNFGYRLIDLDLVVPAANRCTRFPCWKNSEKIAYYGAAYYLFHDTEASYADILVDGTDDIGELFIRNMVLNSSNELKVDPLFVLNEPTKIDLYEYKINVPRFGTENKEVFVVISNMSLQNPGDYKISASIAGPRFSVFFNPVFPHFMTVSIYSKDTPHAYALQQGMTSDLSIMLQPVRENLYQGTYPIDSNYPGTATFSASGTGPDKSSGTIQWKMDIANIAPDTKANITFDDITLKSSAAAFKRTVVTTRVPVELDENSENTKGLVPLGDGIVFSCFTDGSSANDSSNSQAITESLPGFTMELTSDSQLNAMSLDPSMKTLADKNALSKTAGIYEISDPTAPRYVGPAGFEANITSPGTYALLSDNSVPSVLSSDMDNLIKLDNPEDGFSLILSDTGSGIEKEYCSFLVQGSQIIKPEEWQIISETPQILKAHFSAEQARAISSMASEKSLGNSQEGPGILVTPQDKAGNNGPGVSFKTLIATAAVPRMICYPNPAAIEAELQINHSLTSVNEIYFDIFDKTGLKLNRLHASGVPGMEKATWDLTSESGMSVSNGVYIVRGTITGNSNGQGNPTKHTLWSKIAVLR